MSEAADRDLLHLSPSSGRLGAAFARPKVLAVICVLTLAGSGWLALGLLSAGMGGLDALCRPLGLGATFGAQALALVAAMWAAMTLAMMLPSAAPMILTYAEIADTAARKGERIVPPFMLAAGYALVWLCFAVVAAFLQFALARVALPGAGMTPASGLVSGAIFIGAGVYQFSALKHACLTQCQRPFPFFFTHWTTTPRGVFGLGLRQGLYCLGCCWAMMLVMLALGAMNVIWMAALGALMTAEKLARGNTLSRLIGVGLIALGAAVALAALAGHWPAPGDLIYEMM